MEGHKVNSTMKKIQLSVCQISSLIEFKKKIKIQISKNVAVRNF